MKDNVLIKVLCIVGILIIVCMNSFLSKDVSKNTLKYFFNCGDMKVDIFSEEGYELLEKSENDYSINIEKLDYTISQIQYRNLIRIVWNLACGTITVALVLLLCCYSIPEVVPFMDKGLSKGVKSTLVLLVIASILLLIHNPIVDSICFLIVISKGLVSIYTICQVFKACMERANHMAEEKEVKE